jgi:hypothetical protein
MENGAGRRAFSPHSLLPTPYSLFIFFARFDSASAPKNAYNLPVLESSNYHIRPVKNGLLKQSQTATSTIRNFETPFKA